MSIQYFSLDEVLAIHAHLIDRYGGALGIRDSAQLESALAMPQATFAGTELHATLYEQAAAYLFHVVKNHPFVDGNKRVGLALALAFLRLNDPAIRATDDELVELVLGVAEGKRHKSDVAVFLAAHAVE